MPHRAPGSPGQSRKTSLSGKPIRYYRPKGSPEIRHLIDEGFQAFNAGRLSEACQIFSEKMLAPENDTTIGLTIAGAMTPAGLGGCVIEMMDRGLVDFVISTGANLYHDLHYALNFTLHRGSPFLNDVELYEDGVIRIYDVLFPATVLLETDAYIRDFIVRSGLNGPIATSEFHYRLGLDLLERFPGCEEHSVVARAAAGRRADLHLVARRQLDRHEHRLSRADERQPLHDRSQQGRQRGVRDRAGRASRTAASSSAAARRRTSTCRRSRRCGRSTASRRAATTTSSRSRPTRSSGAACPARRRPKPSAGAR